MTASRQLVAGARHRLLGLLGPADGPRRKALRRRLRPVRFGSLRSLTPVSREWGADRGTPIDRWYIEDFLGRNSDFPGYAHTAIGGRVLEVGGREYAERFLGGGTRPVGRVDVLHVDGSNDEATLIGDLTRTAELPERAYDCIICTQTLQVIFDVPSAVASLHRMLDIGGTALVTVPGISRAITPDRDAWGDWWRFTAGSARRSFEREFAAEDVTVEAYGNVLAATAFLQGIAAEELEEGELLLRDPDYEVTIAIRAVRR